MATRQINIAKQTATRVAALTDGSTYSIQNTGGMTIRIRATDDLQAPSDWGANKGYLLRPYEYGRIRQSAGGAVWLYCEHSSGTAAIDDAF